AGGVFLVHDGNRMAAFAPGANGEWSRVPLEIPVPDSLFDVPHVLVSPDGRPVWLSHERTMEDPPMIVRLWPGESRRDTLVRIPGDARVVDIHPDGEKFLALLQDSTSARYREALYEVPVDDSRSLRLVYDNGGHLDRAEYDPFGEHILMLVAGRPDSLLIVDGSGRRIAAHTADRMGGQSWCGPTRVALTARTVGALQAQVGLWDLLGDSIRPVVTDVDNPTALHCSPNGRYLVVSGTRSADVVTEVVDLQNASLHELPSPTVPRGMTWLPRERAARPQRIRIRPAESLSLETGERRRLSAELVTRDASSLTYPVRWRSTDPWIVAVSGDGVVSGNSEGEAYAVAEYTATLKDSVKVTVQASRAPVILRDRFETLDTLRWVVGGSPVPVADRVDGRPVLRLRGDGRWRDGVVLRDPLNLEAGVTVEAEIYLELNRSFWQRVGFCVEPGTPPEDGDERDLYRWVWGVERFCIAWPAYELARFAPDEVAFTPGYLRSFPDLPLGRAWVHLGIEVQPDGRAAVMVDREKVYTMQASAPIDPDHP
ncbi:MAG: Ig-like domain-containing protein, partial [Halobacteriales archaeon]|nr:Ig-like domain-containing protein [Halobacteriales archaeon]